MGRIKVEAMMGWMVGQPSSKEKAFREEGRSLSNHSLQKKDKGGLG